MADLEEHEGQAQQEQTSLAGSESPPASAHSDINGEDEATRLRALAADVRDQDDLERNVGRQARTRIPNLTFLTLIFNVGKPNSYRSVK